MPFPSHLFLPFAFFFHFCHAPRTPRRSFFGGVSAAVESEGEAVLEFLGFSDRFGGDRHLEAILTVYSCAAPRSLMHCQRLHAPSFYLGSRA